jgi:arylamine N-acetyltransferase
MNLSSVQVKKYLNYLGINKRQPSLKALEELTRLQIIKFPFENISKLILLYKKNLKGLVDFETHIENSIKYGLGGTCYANNYYFNQLLSSLGYDISLHGADMQEGIDVHMVSFIKIENEKYLVDVGYGAPFYKPLLLNSKSLVTLNWGELYYKLTKDKNGRPQLTVFKQGDWVHDYIVNFEERQINHFTDIVEDSFRDEAEFMRRLRIIRYFNDYSVELSNFKYTINNRIDSNSYQLKSIDQVEEMVIKEFKLPNFPVREAYKILTNVKGINFDRQIFDY